MTDPANLALCSSQTTGDAIITINPDSRATTAVNPVSDHSEKPGLQSKQESGDALKSAEEAIRDVELMRLENYFDGYPLQAAFQSSESCFSIYRAFSYLHSRVILNLQDELRCLENDLYDLDEDSNNSPEMRRCLSSRQFDLQQAKRKKMAVSERAKLLETIREKLVNYDEILTKAKEINVFQKPSTRDYRSLRRWLYNKSPVVEDEERWVKKKDDLITLRCGREWAGFDGWIEECVKKLNCRFIRWLFTTPAIQGKTSDPHVTYFCPTRISNLVGLVITFIIFILLVSPVVAMYKLTNVGDRNSTFDAVGILVIFTLLFSAAMSLLTKAKRHELFAASAAYCAVLVVFISNIEKNSGKGRGISP